MRDTVFFMLGLLLGRFFIKAIEERVSFPNLHVIFELDTSPSRFERWLLNQ